MPIITSREQTAVRTGDTIKVHVKIKEGDKSAYRFEVRYRRKIQA